MVLVNDLAEMRNLLGSIDLAAIIFDFDGTLVDSEPAWKSTFFDLFKERHGISISKEILWENTGNGVDLSVKNISNKYDLNLSESETSSTANDLHLEMQRKIIEELPLREGAIEVMDWAQQNDIALAICTASTSDLIDAYFEKHGLRDRFSHVFSTAVSEIEKRKPYAYPYLETMKLLRVQADQTIVIEDSPSGIKSAVSAGIRTIAIQDIFIEDQVSEAHPIFQVTDFSQVLELLASL